MTANTQDAFATSWEVGRRHACWGAAVPPVKSDRPMTTGSGGPGISQRTLFGLSRGNARFLEEQVEEESAMQDLLAVAERTREIPMLLEEYVAREHSDN
jgi:hypothetical protein